jgi:membrane-associated protease RseP (regulator of RpoE activity)
VRRLDARRIAGLIVLLLVAAAAAVLVWRWSSGRGPEEAAPPSVDGADADAGQRDPAVTRTGDGVYTIARAAWDEWLSSPRQMVGGVKAVAALQGEVQRGFTLQEIAPGSVAARLGLQAGDIVTHLDGTPLASLIAVMRTVAALRSAAEVVIRFERGGQERVHTYRIVPPVAPAGPAQDAAPVPADAGRSPP